MAARIRGITSRTRTKNHSGLVAWQPVRNTDHSMDGRNKTCQVITPGASSMITVQSRARKDGYIGIHAHFSEKPTAHWSARDALIIELDPVMTQPVRITFEVT